MVTKMNAEEKWQTIKVFVQNKIDENNEMYHNTVRLGGPTGPLLGEMEVLEQIEIEIMKLDGEINE